MVIESTMMNATNTSTHAITAKELGDLLNFFSSTQYRLKDIDKKTAQIEEQCIRLISRDYTNLIVIPNDKKQLSTTYPTKIVIPEIENSFVEQQQTLNAKSFIVNNDQVPPYEEINNFNINQFKTQTNDVKSKKFDVKKLKDLISKARVARCRARFPIPAILYKNKYICRSATLSSAAEIYGRSVLDYTFNDNKNYSQNSVQSIETEDDDFVKAHIEKDSPPVPNTLNIGDSTKLFSHFRNQDIKLLKYFSVKLICDLMLEKKKVKFGMNVTSSEKADKENRYSEFNILSLPYPGCEFFREYRDNNYCGEGLIYDWNQDFVDAEFGLVNCEEVSKILNINFKEYRSWDVIRLTQNYIKLLLYFLKEFDSSILVHCISGWDRTPLFISLLRLTLWADGEIHKSLNAVEITYLTVAYDWFLFGHNLNDRLNKGEEIMFFCFQFLKFIIGNDYSINHHHSEVTSKNDLGHEQNKSNMQQSMTMVRKISIDSISPYEDFIIENIPNHNNYNGSSTSLNRNNSKHDDSFSLVTTFEIESGMKINSNNKNGINVSLQNINMELCSEKDQTSSSSLPAEMISTLTLNDVDEVSINSNHFGSSSRHDSFNEDSNLNTHLHSSTQPVEIPNSNNSKNLNQAQIPSDGSLCRSDSWQFVSDASSIIDNHIFNHFSSPDSLSSLNNKKSTSPMNFFPNQMPSLYEHRKHKSECRGKKLLEVRSLFNSAYTSINFNHNNSCSLTNFVDHLYRTVNI